MVWFTTTVVGEVRAEAGEFLRAELGPSGRWAVMSFAPAT
jgi:hypothetical protein